MFDTYFEQKAAMEPVDYRSNEGDAKLYAVCKCKGKIKDGEPKCIRNPDGDMARSGGVCIWIMQNGSLHCSHRFPPKPDASGNP